MCYKAFHQIHLQFASVSTTRIHFQPIIDLLRFPHKSRNLSFSPSATPSLACLRPCSSPLAERGKCSLSGRGHLRPRPPLPEKPFPGAGSPRVPRSCRRQPPPRSSVFVRSTPPCHPPPPPPPPPGPPPLRTGRRRPTPASFAAFPSGGAGCGDDFGGRGMSTWQGRTGRRTAATVPPFRRSPLSSLAASAARCTKSWNLFSIKSG